MAYTIINKKKIEDVQKELEQRNKVVEAATEFVAAIESGKFDTQLEDIGFQSELLSSLEEMRKRLKENEEKDRQSKWVSQGLTNFVDLLRTHSGSEAFYDTIIRYLVSYLNANQGALYVTNENEEQQVEIELAAIYAWKRKKYLQEKILPGEGLVGQCYLEKELILLSNVPKDYIQITSGLGDVSPDSVVLLPMIFEDKVMGILEIASFEKFEDFQIDYLLKAVENLAASVSSMMNSEITQHLLEEAKKQTLELRSQEEEMRQNLEELSATQEEMRRKQKVLVASETKNKLFFEKSFYGILGIDIAGKIIDANQSSSNIFDLEEDELIESQFDDLIEGEGFNNFSQTIGIKRRIKIIKTQKVVDILVNKASEEGDDLFVAYINGDISEELYKEEKLEKAVKEIETQTRNLEKKGTEILVQKKISDTLMHQSLDAVFLLSSYGYVMEFNKKASEKLKIDPKKPLNIENMIQGFKLTEAKSYLNKQQRVNITDGEGAKFKAEIYMTEVKLDREDVYIIYIRDISTLITSEERITQLEEEIRILKA